MMKYVLKRGGKMGGSFQVINATSISSDIPKLGNGTIQALASFYKDDNYRSLLLVQGIKLLEMLITGRFSHTVILEVSLNL